LAAFVFGDACSKHRVWNTLGAIFRRASFEENILFCRKIATPRKRMQPSDVNADAGGKAVE